MKKIIAFLCTFLMLFSSSSISKASMLNVDIANLASNTMKIEAGNIECKPGEKVELPITVSNTSNILGAMIRLSYDEALTLTEVKKGDGWATLTLTPPGDLSMNPVNIVWDGEKDDSTNGVIAYAVFQVPDQAGSYNISLSYVEGDIIDGDFNEVPVELIGATIKAVADEHEHTYSSVISKEATCTEKGVKTYTCKMCNDSYTEEIAAKGHSEVEDKAVEASCTETGLTAGKHCSVCGEVLVEQKEVAVKEHSFDKGTVTKEPTEEAEGEKTYTCEICGATKTEVVAALSHTHQYSETISKEATCKQEGEKLFTCSCGDSYTEKIEKLPHTETEDEAVEATCTEAGLTAGKHCSVCGKVLVEQKEVAAKGHSFDKGTVTKEPTEEAEGEKTYTCEICGATKTETIDKLGAHEHEYEESISKEATCTEAGEKTFTCACGDSYTERIPKLPHTEVIDEGVEATCTKAGVTEGKHCSVCNEELVEQKVIKAKGHKFDEGVVLKEATCNTEGVYMYICSVCDDTKSEVIPKIVLSEEEKLEYNESVPAKQAIKVVTNANTDKADPKGATFAPIFLKAAGGNKQVKLAWKAVAGADGYQLYGSMCGKKMKLLKQLPAGTKSYTYKKLKKGKYYKFIIQAYKMIGGEKRVIKTSMSIHACTSGTKYGNPSKLTYAKSSISINTGKKFTLKPVLKKAKGKTVKIHMAKFRYESSKPLVAKVDKKGNIKGLAKGKCYIYIIAQNGLYKRVKVTVK